MSPPETRTRITLLLPAPQTLIQYVRIDRILSNLKLRCQRDFEQDLVWITIHRVDRITAHDPPPPG